MTKLQKLIQIVDDSLYSNRYLKFLETEFGQLYQNIPFEELGKLLPSKKTNVGAKTRLSPEGFFGLMFLKHYTNLSDSQLINHLNTNWAMQYFCSIQLREDEMIKDKGMPSRIRGFIAEHVDIEDIQKVLLDSWKDDMENLHVQLNDATAYESYIKFPTDVKLLWDCTYWVYETLHALHKTLGIRKPRSKYNDHKVSQLSYQKKRKKTYKMTRIRRRALLRLLKKGIGLCNYEHYVNEHISQIVRTGWLLKFFWNWEVIIKAVNNNWQNFDALTKQCLSTSTWFEHLSAETAKGPNVYPESFLQIFQPYQIPVLTITERIVALRSH